MFHFLSISSRKLLRRAKEAVRNLLQRIEMTFSSVRETYEFSTG